MRVIFSPSAELDLKEIDSFYKNEVGSNISNDFALSLENIILNLSKFPNMGKTYITKKTKVKVQVFGLQDFPQLVFYKYNKNEKSLEIIRILHGRRNNLKMF